MLGGDGIQQEAAGPGGNILQNERQVVRRAGRQAICSFLDQHNCFSVLRTSGKVVVFDTRIPIQLAFYALVEHGMYSGNSTCSRHSLFSLLYSCSILSPVDSPPLLLPLLASDMLAAPLWEPKSCKFVGLLTVTDFIDILRHYQATGKDVSTLATSSIAEILAAEQASADSADATESGADGEPKQKGLLPHRGFCGADSSCTLKQACQQLLNSNSDFLPIVFPQDMRVLSCITYTNILEHLVTHFREQRRLFDDCISDLGIGTWNNLITVQHSETLSHALELMQQNNLSALPVLDPSADNKLIGVYSRSDITFLTKATDAEDAVRNLDLPLSEILQIQRADVTTPDALRTCSPGHTLQAIFESFSQVRFNRLYVVDAQEKLMGVVTAKDLVAYFLLE